jgi:hypothetical protein
VAEKARQQTAMRRDELRSSLYLFYKYAATDWVRHSKEEAMRQISSRNKRAAA